MQRSRVCVFRHNTQKSSQCLPSPILLLLSFRWRDGKQYFLVSNRRRVTNHTRKYFFSTTGDTKFFEAEHDQLPSKSLQRARVKPIAARMITATQRRKNRTQRPRVALFVLEIFFFFGLATAFKRYALLGHQPSAKQHEAYIWTTDLHAGPIGCQIQMFDSLEIGVLAQVDFPNCKFFHNTNGHNLCATDRKGLLNNEMRGYSLDPLPEITIARLKRHYRRVSAFQKADYVFCAHPVANCEIYLDSGKTMIVYATTRIEFGRNDEYVWWRKRYLGQDKDERWFSWATTLAMLGSSSRHIVAANNLYDATYIEYMTGTKVLYIPSWCAGSPSDFSRIRYSPEASEFVLVPYRLNLEFDKASIPQQGWPENDDRQYGDDILQHPIFTTLHHLEPERGFKLVSMKNALNGEFKSVLQFHRFRGLVFIPYQASTMFFFEVYRACVPILAPSKSLLTHWIESERLMWEVSYGDPKRINVSLHSHLPSPNAFDARSRKMWMDFYDIYNGDVFPHLLYFNNWEEAANIVLETDLQQVSERMCDHNLREYYRIRMLWLNVFSRNFNSEE